MANRYGLDTDYIGKNLDILLRDIGNYTPEEMGRALRRIADTASPPEQVVSDEQISMALEATKNHPGVSYNHAYSRDAIRAIAAALEGK